MADADCAGSSPVLEAPDDVGCALRFLSLAADAADVCGAGDAEAVPGPDEGARWIGKLAGRDAACADGVGVDAASSDFAGAAAMDTPDGADIVRARYDGRGSRMQRAGEWRAKEG